MLKDKLKKYNFIISKVIYFLIFAVVLVIDQVTKSVLADMSGVKGTLSNGGTKLIFTVIKGFLTIEYCENTRGAMGLFGNIPNIQTIFIIVTVVILIGIFAYMIISKNRGKWLNVSLALILSGAFGNFIDRLTTVYVRDFIHVIININGQEFFPYIFNVADMALCVGAGMLVVYLLFIDKDALFKKKNNNQEIGKEENE